MKSIKTNFCFFLQNFIYSFLLRHRLLVEAGRLSLLLRYTDLTKVILDALANIRLKVIAIKKKILNYFICVLKEPEYLLEVRLLQAEYMVKSLGESEQLYSKSSVEVKRIFCFYLLKLLFYSRFVFELLN